MNPLGMILGAALGLVILLAATIISPVVVLRSRRVQGAERFFWFALVSGPSVIYWTNTYHDAPVPIALAGAVLSPVVLAVFLLLTRKHKKPGVIEI